MFQPSKIGGDSLLLSPGRGPAGKTWKRQESRSRSRRGRDGRDGRDGREKVPVGKRQKGDGGFQYMDIIISIYIYIYIYLVIYVVYIYIYKLWTPIYEYHYLNINV